MGRRADSRSCVAAEALGGKHSVLASCRHVCCTLWATGPCEGRQSRIVRVGGCHGFQGVAIQGTPRVGHVLARSVAIGLAVASACPAPQGSMFVRRIAREDARNAIAHAGALRGHLRPTGLG